MYTILYFQHMTTEPDNIIRVSISEGARLLGINAATIRRAIKDQEIRYIIVKNRYKINFESLVRWSQQKNTVKNKMEKKGIGQFVDKWKISNIKYSPNPRIFKNKDNQQNPQ